MRPPLIRGGNGDMAPTIHQMEPEASMRPPLIRGGNFTAQHHSFRAPSCFNEAAPDQGRK